MQQQDSNKYIKFIDREFRETGIIHFLCDRRKFNLTADFFNFLFLVTGRGITFSAMYKYRRDIVILKSFANTEWKTHGGIPLLLT